MLSLTIVVHRSVAYGSFPIEVHYDLIDEFYEKSGWDSYRQAQNAMVEWCGDRWGETPGRTEPGVEALWMTIGKRFFVRTEQQACELRMRWHGATH
jgi:hypothetical protein